MSNERQKRIEIILHPLQTEHLEIINESHMHSVPSDSETHFKLIIVTEQFNTMSLLARHRHINQLLAAELANGLHALSLELYTPDEWNKKGKATSSPACKGGFGK